MFRLNRKLRGQPWYSTWREVIVWKRNYDHITSLKNLPSDKNCLRYLKNIIIKTFFLRCFKFFLSEKFLFILLKTSTLWMTQFVRIFWEIDIQLRKKKLCATRNVSISNNDKKMNARVLILFPREWFQMTDRNGSCTF